MPKNKLPRSSGVNNNRRTIPWLFGSECAPKFLPGVFVKSDHRAALAARQADELFTIDQRMAGETPHRGLSAAVLFEIARPKHVAIFRIEAIKVALGAERIDFSAANLWCDSRSGRIADRVRTIVFIFPKHLPIRFIQANHTLDSLNLAALEGVGRITHTGGKLAIGNVKAT